MTTSLVQEDSDIEAQTVCDQGSPADVEDDEGRYLTQCGVAR